MTNNKKRRRFFLFTNFNPFQILECGIPAYNRAVIEILNKDTKTALSEDLQSIKKDGETAIKKHKSELEACLCP